MKLENKNIDFLGQRGSLDLPSLIAVGLVSTAVMLGTLGILRTLMTAGNKSQVLLEEDTSDVVSLRQFWFDLRSSEPSYNQVSIQDDSGKGFFDYLPDVSCIGATGCRRHLTLTATDNRSLVLALTDRGFVPSSLNPSVFYSVLGNRSITSTPALRFEESRLKDTLQRIPGLLAHGRILRFYSPVNLRPEAQSANLSIPPRMPSLLVSVTENPRESDAQRRWRLSVVNPPGFPQDNRHPATNQVYSDIDSFFRQLPPIAGGATLLYVEPVNIVRYRLAPSTYRGKRVSSLIREAYNGSLFEKRRTVAMPIEKLVLMRDSLSAMPIRVKLDGQELHAPGAQ